jgi:hypothetical protein
MPADSVIKAVENLIAGLTAANFPALSVPPVWLDQAPLQGATGSQQHPPYIIIVDKGGKPAWDTETNAVISGAFTISAYSRTLGDADLMMKAVLWNGAIPSLRLGLAFANISINPPLYTMGGAMTPTTDKHGYAGFQDYEGKRVHFASQDFEYQLTLRGTG